MADEQSDRTDSKTGLLARRDALKLLGGTALVSLGAGGISGQEGADTFVVDATEATWSYRIETTGEISRISTDGEAEDSIDGGVVEGTATAGQVAYELTGDVTALTLDGPSTFAFGPDAGGTLRERRQIAISSPTEVSYELTTSGEITKVMNDSSMAAEDNDTIAANDDGTWTATGYTGNGYGDTFEFLGNVTDFAPLDGDVDIQLDGESVTARELAGEERSWSTLELVADGELAYEFTVDGAVSKLTDIGDRAAEDNDTVTDNGDGTRTVSGYTGNGYGDSFDIAGEVTDFSPMEGTFSLRLDDEAVTPYDLTGEERPTRRVAVVSQTKISYEFTATGPIEKVRDGSDRAAEGNDTVTDNGDGTWTAAGFTGNGYGDSFDVTGSIADFSPLDGDYTLYVDGDAVSAYDLTGVEKPASGGGSSSGTPVVGGGAGYEDVVDPSQATDVVSTASQLVDALGRAGSGDVVYVDGSAEINLGSQDIAIPSGVTLASDRGIDGAAGGHVYTNQVMWPLVYVGSNARVTGLRVSGPSWSYRSYDADAVDMGLRVTGSGVEIDNNEIYGFTHAAVRPAGDTHVHHNDIHHNPMDGLGYGVSTTAGKPLIEYNTFNYNRHSIASGGGNGYIARYNHFGPDAVDHVMDMHRPGGTTIEIHHNTVEAVRHVQDNGGTECVAIRGTPSDVADIHANWFYNPNEPKSQPEGWDGSAITQVHTSRWQNVEFANNHYGSDEPAPDIGCPR